MSRERIVTERAPAAIGPYSQAIVCGDLVFTSGQIALDPATGQMVEGDVRAQARQVLQNVQALLEASNSSLAQVLKTTVFLTSLDDYAAVNEVYAEFFADVPPARSAVAVAGLPRNALVEVETVALCTPKP